MKKRSSWSRATLVLALAALFSVGGCQSLKDAASALNAFKKLQFKLGDVDNFRLAGVDLSRLQNPSKLSFTDGASLLSAFNKKKLPVSFRLNVEAKNPNPGGREPVAQTSSSRRWSSDFTLTGRRRLTVP